MPIRIQNQQQMRAHAKRVQFCYLCGESLRHPDGTDDGPIAREHVVPASVYGPRPTSQADSWRIVLSVHERCDQAAKSKPDDFFRVLHRCSSEHPQQWSSSDWDLLRPLVTEVEVPGADLRLPALSGVESAVSAVWQWVRGCHAAIYADFLAATVLHEVLLPVPTVRGTSVDDRERSMQLENLLDRTGLVVSIASDSNDRWDGILAWGGRVTFKCRWVELPAVSRSAWMCMWWLDIPGVRSWGASVTGVDRPLRGMFRLSQPPPLASTMLIEELE